MTIARSFLFVPGDSTRKLTGARERGADAVIIDLEDAVAPARRDDALAITASWLEDQDEKGSEMWLRVSSAQRGCAELEALEADRLAGVVVPKVRSTADLEHLARTGVAMIAFIETAQAVLDVASIAAQDGIRRLVIGEADLGAELGIAPVGGDTAFGSIRSQVVVASAAAGIEAPIGPVDPDFRDLARFAESTVSLRDHGFGGRCCIHPAQLDVVNDVFTPTPNEVAAALRLVAHYEVAAAAGEGVIVAEDGTMVDEAYVRTARRTLERARRAGSLGVGM